MRRSCRDLSHACGSLVLARKTLPRPYFPATFSCCGPASVRRATVLRYLRVAVRDDPSPWAPSTLASAFGLEETALMTKDFSPSWLQPLSRSLRSGGQRRRAVRLAGCERPKVERLEDRTLLPVSIAST